MGIPICWNFIGHLILVAIICLRIMPKSLTWNLNMLVSKRGSPFLGAENLRFPSKNYLGDDLNSHSWTNFSVNRVSSLIRAAAAAAAAAVPMEEFPKLCSAAAADTKRSTPRCKSHVLRDSAAVETPQTRLCKVKKPPVPWGWNKINMKIHFFNDGSFPLCWGVEVWWKEFAASIGNLTW